MKTRSSISLSLLACLALICTLDSYGQGAISSGEVATGGIAAAGEIDSWTTVANQGDRIVVQVAEASGGAAFAPRIEVIAPDGTVMGASTGGTAARLDLQAHVTGTFTIAVSDNSRTGTGTYRLQLARVPAAFTVPAGDEGGALTNGVNHQGVIDVGDLDLWTFTASPGDRIALQSGETAGAAAFTPLIELFAPNGARLGAGSGGVAARVDAQAVVGGTYTVLVSDFNQSGAGSYRLRLAQVPGAFVLPAGDDGGALTNGENQSGTIDVGDLDLWTFTASEGDRIVLQLGELSGASGFTPMIELFAPNGARLAADSDGAVARVDAQAHVGGTYTVLVSDFNQSGTGTYQLRLGRIPGAFAVPAGDEGGALADATDQDGTIGAGDFDLWTFNAVAGDRLTVLITELTGGAGFTPKIELFAPNGHRQTIVQGASTAMLDAAVEIGGTYTVLVSDANQIGAGTYRLRLTRGAIAAPGPNVLINGTTHLGSITSAGESNIWTFTATAGESLVVRAGETATTALLVWLRISGPNGVLLTSDFNAAAAEVQVRATNSGTFSVAIADGSAGRNQTGNYRISLAKTGSPLAISPSDEGGFLVNGASYVSAIETGDLDTWTFTANAGETIAVWMGETTANSTLYPWLRLYGPDGVLVGNDFNPAAAQVTVRATNSGTFLVVVGDGSAGFGGIGNYRSSLAKTGSPLAISPSDEGGALENGTSYTAAIETGDVDAWTFIANAGESIVVRAGETTAETLYPWIRLFSPNGVLLSEDFNPAVGEVTFRATNSGMFTVIFGDASAGRSGSGNYRLSLAKTGRDLAISPSDEGGALINGTTYPATIDTGDVDAWSFIANAGESIVVRAGETTAETLYPWIRLFSPNGVLLSEDFNPAAGEVTFRATNSGTFIVIFGDASAGRSGSGNYRLSLAKTGVPLVISPSDEGADLVNGTTYLATIDTGDIDAWNFTASAGENIIVRMGETTAASPLYPWLRLYSPNGVLLNADFNPAAAEATFRATNNGTFLVVVGDGNSGLGGIGDYRLSLAKTGSPLTISPSDEGGLVVNGTTYLATIDTGDIDAWTFTANTGENILVRMGETTASSPLYPWLRLYGPNGVLLHADFNAAAAEVTFRATNSGTFQVVVSDGNNGIGGGGNYRLSLARTGAPLVITPGDEGGAMTASGTYDGAVDVGDVDAWIFTSCAGETISLRVDESVTGSLLYPWIRLYGRDGVLLNSDFGPASAQITRVASANGTYLVVVADGNNGIGGAGTYRLTVNGLYAGIKMCPPMRISGALGFQGAGGSPNSAFIVITATNVTTPTLLWTPILTNNFGVFGEFNFTNLINPNLTEQYFQIRTP